MISYLSISEKIYSLLHGFGYHVDIYDIMGNDTVESSAGIFFYVKELPVMIVLDEEQNELILNKNKNTSYETIRQLLSRLRLLSNEYIMSFTVRNFGKIIEPKDFSNMAKKEEVTESAMTGTLKTSYLTMENAKLIVQHYDNIDESKKGCRSRNIKNIFVEKDGKRTKLSTNYLPAGKACTCHCNRGGEPNDEVSNAIVENAKKLSKLREFVRYARTNSLINEDSEQTLDVITKNINSLKESFYRIQKESTYELECTRLIEKKEKKYSEKSSGIKDMFTKKYFDNEFETLVEDISNMVEENDEYEQKLMSTLDEDLYVDYMPTGVFKFDTKEQEQAHKLREFANSIQENQIVKEFINGVANKIIKKKASKFDKKLVGKLIAKSKFKPIKKIK